MDCAFYHSSGSPRGWRRAFVPFQRAVRRVQRPYFQRLHDILLALWHSSRQREHEIHTLHQRLSALEHSHAELAQRHRALQMDRGAAARRLAQLEERSTPRLWREAA